MIAPTTRSRKVVRSFSWFSTGHNSACSNIQISDQFVQQSSAFKPDRHSPVRERRRLPSCSIAQQPTRSIICGTQIPIARRTAARPSPAVSLYGAFFVKEFGQGGHGLLFVGFFVRSEARFFAPLRLRRRAQEVSRLVVAPTLRCSALARTASSTPARLPRSG